MFVNFCQIIQYSQLHITWQQGGVNLCFASQSHQKYASYKFPLDLTQSNQTAKIQNGTLYLNPVILCKSHLQIIDHF